MNPTQSTQTNSWTDAQSKNRKTSKFHRRYWTTLSVLERARLYVSTLLLGTHIQKYIHTRKRRNEPIRNQQRITQRKQEDHWDGDGARALKQHRNGKTHTRSNPKAEHAKKLRTETQSASWKVPTFHRRFWTKLWLFWKERVVNFSALAPIYKYEHINNKGEYNKPTTNHILHKESKSIVETETVGGSNILI